MLVHSLRARSGSALRIAFVAGAITLALIAIGQLGPTGNGSPSGEPLPPTGLGEAVANVFASGRCMNSTEATRDISQELSQRGFADWTVTTAESVRPGNCVGAAVLAREQRILLMPAVSAPLRVAIDKVQEDLLTQCLDMKAAKALAAQYLTQADAGEWQVSTDGPVGGPVNRFDEVMHHIDSGCYVYSGTGWTADGVRIVYLTGKR